MVVTLTWIFGFVSAVQIREMAGKALKEVGAADIDDKAFAISLVCWVLSPLADLFMLALFTRYAWRAMREIFPAKRTPEAEPVVGSYRGCPICGHEPYTRQ